MNEMTMKIRVKSAEHARELGARLASGVRRASLTQAIVIALNGELGVGKTTLVSGFLRAMGVEGAIRSPTYTLIEPYELDACIVYHLDLYRLATARDLDMLALRDLLNPGAVLLVEWASRGREALPVQDLALELTYVQAAASSTAETTERDIEISFGSSVGKELANSLQE